MASTLLSFGALFTSTLFFLMGGGVLNTQLSLRMTQEGFSTPAIGITLACYFLGLMSGYFLCHRLIQRVGHIRSFAVFAAGTTAITILHGFYLKHKERVARIPVAEQVNFVPMKNTSPVATVLDPRADAGGDMKKSL